MKRLINIIVPCYNEEKSLPLFYKETLKIIKNIKDKNFEFIFVNDGSNDKTLNVIKKLSINRKNIKYLSFSRNFGKEAAMYAGMKESNGEYVVIMDADLQDPPSLLVEMIRTIDDGEYDVVATRRVSRKGEPLIRSFFARMFYKIINRLSDIDIVDGARDYRIMTRKVADAILDCQEYNRFSKGLFSFVGFNTKWLEYENVKRASGETKWSFFKLFKYALEGIISFSTLPLSFASVFGIIICFISFIAIIFIVIRTLLFGDPVGGWPSMVCILLFVSGIQLLCMGIIGQYLAKTYLETKKRPIYIIKEKN